MAVDYLDLDAIDKPVGRLKIAGQEYDVHPLSVKAIFNLLHLERIKSEDINGDTYGMMIDSLQELLPECPKAVLENLKLPQLQTLMSWAQDVSQASLRKNSDPPAQPKILIER